MCKYTRDDIEEPTTIIVNNCIYNFDRTEETNENNVAMTFNAFNCDTIEHIFAKVVVLNNIYCAGLHNNRKDGEKYVQRKFVDVKMMTDYIYENRALFNGEKKSRETVIQWIDTARNHFIQLDKNSPHSFLTKYCAWSFLDLNLPIVDSHTKGMLYYMDQLYSYYKDVKGKHFTQDQIRYEKYAFFCEVYDTFVEFYKDELPCEKTKHKDIDKYLWYYGKHGSEKTKKAILLD